jgi:hypothetical protein
MSKFFVVRNSCGIDSEIYYEEKTDVWFLGDVQGYESFLKCLSSAVGSKRNVHLWSLAKNECNMLLCVLPPVAIKNTRPIVRFWERFVWHKGKPWMELVISGNKSGYHKLILRVKRFLGNTSCDTSGHDHFDDQTWDRKWIRARSVSINMRGPLKKWSLSGLQENGHDQFIQRKLPGTIPFDLRYQIKNMGDIKQASHLKYREISKSDAESVWNDY